MSRHFRIGSSLPALLVAAALSLPAPAFSWGWAAHAFLEGNLGPASEASLYGAVLPDFPQVIQQTDYRSFLEHQTHYKFARLTAKSTFFGLPDLGAAFAGHNEVFGADHSAHVAGFTNPPGTGGYVVFKTGLLLLQPLPFPSGTLTISEFLASLFQDNGIPAEAAFPLAPELAHSVVEEGVDLLLVLEGVDPAAGCQVFFSSLARDAESVQGLLIKSYGRNFAARARIPFEDAASVIADAETGFQELAASYGASLCPLLPDRPFQPVETLAALNALRLNQLIQSMTGSPPARPITFEESLTVLSAVPPLVQADYQQELAETLAALAGRRHSP